MITKEERIIDVLIDRFASAGEAPALVFQDQVRAYSEISRNLDYFIGLLQSSGVEKGRTVVLKADYCFNSVLVLLALIKLNVIIVPVLPVSFEKLKSSIKKTNPTFVITVNDIDGISVKKWESARKEHPLIKELISKNATGLVLFTSGSSGKPKGVVHNFEKLLEKFREFRSALRTINFLVFDHWGGLNTLLHGLSNCSVVVLPENRNPEHICHLIARNKVELLPTTPSFLNILLASQAWKNYDLGCLKVISYGAEPMPESTLKRCSEIFKDVEFRQTYGLIELGVLRAKSQSTSSLWVKLGGKGYDLRVVDNMLQIKAESAMLGYIDAPSPFSADGYFLTGDKVEIEGEYFRILGRDTDLINVGGEKVYPMEVESVLLSCENVGDAFVYAEKHLLLGNIVCASIVLERPESLRDIRNRVKAYCTSNLASHKVPVKISVVDGNIYSERMKKVRKN